MPSDFNWSKCSVDTVNGPFIEAKTVAYGGEKSKAEIAENYMYHLFRALKLVSQGSTNDDLIFQIRTFVDILRSKNYDIEPLNYFKEYDAILNKYAPKKSHVHVVKKRKFLNEK